jgi:hypothetical protein
MIAGMRCAMRVSSDFEEEGGYRQKEVSLHLESQTPKPEKKRSTGLLFRSKQRRQARAGDRSNKVLLTLSQGEGRCDVTGTANHWQSIPDLGPALAPCEPIACHYHGLLLICLGSPSNAAGATRVGPCCPSREAQTAGATVIDKRRGHSNCSPTFNFNTRDRPAWAKLRPVVPARLPGIRLQSSPLVEAASVLGELLP